MAGYRRQKADGPNSEEKALDLFAEMMIEKIESISKDWRKPWFTLRAADEQAGQGRTGTAEGLRAARREILPGDAYHFHLHTIKYDDYKRLSDDEKQEYNVYPKMQVFRVFNVQQTNLREARPELWEKLEKENSRPEIDAGERFDFEPVDRMINENLWICPIHPRHQDEAYYSMSKNEIVVPEKGQFKDGEAFYGTLFHEMTHSTGAEGVRLRSDQKSMPGRNWWPNSAAHWYHNATE